MIERMAALVLPLMHHLVQQCVQCLVPTVSSQMTPTDRDLAALVRVRRGIVTEAAPHPTRDANGYRLERAMEMFGVELRVILGQSVSRRLIVWARAFAARRSSRRRAGRSLHSERHDSPLCHTTLATRSSFDERNDRTVHLFRRRQVAFVYAEIAPAKAHHHVPIPRQPTLGDPTEAKCSETRQELVRGARRGVELQGELRRIVFAETENRSQRTKHFTGPATKSRWSFDHTSVDTSMSASAMRMLFTDDGRPPRERLLIVPDVEMIVPRFVCSI